MNELLLLAEAKEAVTYSVGLWEWIGISVVALLGIITALEPIAKKTKTEKDDKILGKSKSILTWLTKLKK